MADNNKVTKIRNDLSIVKTSRGYKWRMHDHMGMAIAASSQYYASHFAARRAALRAAKRMKAWLLTPADGLTVGIDPAQPHGDFSATAPAAKQAEAKPAPRKRFGLFGRG